MRRSGGAAVAELRWWSCGCSTAAVDKGLLILGQTAIMEPPADNKAAGRGSFELRPSSFTAGGWGGAIKGTLKLFLHTERRQYKEQHSV